MNEIYLQNISKQFAELLPIVKEMNSKMNIGLLQSDKLYTENELKTVMNTTEAIIIPEKKDNDKSQQLYKLIKDLENMINVNKEEINPKQTLEYINSNILKNQRFSLIDIEYCSKTEMHYIPFTNANKEHKKFTINRYFEIINEFDKYISMGLNNFEIILGSNYHKINTINNTINLRNHIELIPLLNHFISKYNYKIDYIVKNFNTEMIKNYDNLTDSEINEIQNAPESSDNHAWKFIKFDVKQTLNNIKENKGNINSTFEQIYYILDQLKIYF
jgi:hypothetical protein